MSLHISSPAFKNGRPIPSIYTCDGQDISPPLQWREAPEGTRSLALICDDPDAPGGTWVHWVLYNLPPQADGLIEDIPALELLPDGSRQGVSDFRRLGYGGPCPPRGNPHRYFFKLYALETLLEEMNHCTKPLLLEAMDGHILAQAELMGTYQRS